MVARDDTCRSCWYLFGVTRGESTVELLGDVRGLEQEWDDLATRSEVSPFLRPGWIEAWWRAFGTGPLAIIALRRDRELVGVLPLQRMRGRLSSPTNFHTPEFGLVAADGRAGDELAGALFARAGRRVSLSFLDSERSDEHRLRTEAERHGYRVLERSRFPSPYLAIDGDWAGYERNLSKNLRNDVRRRRRRLEEAGAVEVDVSRGEERLDELLDEGFAVEGSGWKNERGTAIVSGEETRHFYRDVARWAASRQLLRLCFLRLDGRAIAFHYNVEDRGRVYHLKGGYDPACERFSPGKVLHYALVERAFASRATRYDFLGANEPYKLQFANASRDVARLEAFAPSLAGGVERAVIAYGRPAVKRVLALLPR